MVLPEPIKSIGSFEVPIKLHKGNNSKTQREGRWRRKDGMPAACNTRTAAVLIQGRKPGRGSGLQIKRKRLLQKYMQKPCEVIDRDVQRGNRTDGRSVSKRVLPHSVEAEQSVIGSMLMDRDAIIAASEIVVADDFYQRQYGINV